MAHPEILAEVSLDVPWKLVEDFSTRPRWKPEDVNASADVIVAALQKAGVPVTVHEAEIYLSVPYDARVKAGGRVIRAKPPAYAIDCRGGITAPIVHVPATYSRGVTTLFAKNQDADASSADRIRGKIVISEGFAFPQKMREFEEKGAVGIIAMNPGVDIHWGICTSIWGTPDLDDLPRKPKIPVVAVNNADGKALIELASRGESVTIETEMREGWFTQKLPVVEIKGTVEPDKFVLLHGHYDSWDVGVGDNATGDAAMVEIARVLWKHRAGLRRTVRIAWWPGHSTGRYAGSTWFADKFAIDLDENCVAQVNCDSPGCRWATLFKDVSWMSETEGYVQGVIKEVCGLDSHGERPHRAGDYSFNNIGISSFFMLSSTMPDDLRAAKGYYAVGGCGGNIAWHTENDTMDIADRDILLRDIKVYLGSILGVANAEILPFDWRATTREFGETLDRYAKAAGAAFDFSETRAALASLDAALGRFHDRIAAGKADAAKANDAIVALARILVPINFTVAPRFRHDPATPVPPLPTLAVATEIANLDAPTQGFAKVQLTRGQNRLVAALRAAQRLVEAAA
ncbi:M28 family peptidase [Alsobacter sp. SYSU M60028]|uniref:Carboxypeptidase Q n=1 Tax=Alsobacter ponti TaxID=2962936 RepID=A0ABT1LHE4_9HYPH|nr:M28 family metallopeptidase [Alsobacter ponti]MCP8940371.1 M28 family peptidase [Alsobacter ponti]